MQVRILALRHAPPQSKGICYGRQDVDVDWGCVDSVELNSQLVELLCAASSEGFQLSETPLVTSPLSRCRRLAEAISLAQGWSVSESADLLELDFGDFEGRAFQELYELDRIRFEHWSSNWQTSSPPRGETIAQLTQRVRHGLVRMARGERKSQVWIAHAGIIRCLHVLLQRRPWTSVMTESVPYLQWTVISGQLTQGLD